MYIYISNKVLLIAGCLDTIYLFLHNFTSVIHFIDFYDEILYLTRLKTTLMSNMIVYQNFEK